MRRGTTPTVTVQVDADISALNIHLAFAAGSLVVKSGGDLTVEYADGVTTIQTTLTQEDTLAMSAAADCEVQVRAFNADGSLAMATDIARVPVKRILEDGPLPEGD